MGPTQANDRMAGVATRHFFGPAGTAMWKPFVWSSTPVPIRNGDVGDENPLRAAVWRGSLAVVELLLEHSADARVGSDDGETPLQVAAA